MLLSRDPHAHLPPSPQGCEQKSGGRLLSAETSPVTQISKWVRWKSDVNEFTCEVWGKKPSSDEGEDKAKGFSVCWVSE